MGVVILVGWLALHAAEEIFFCERERKRNSFGNEVGRFEEVWIFGVEARLETFEVWVVRRQGVGNGDISSSNAGIAGWGGEGLGRGCER